MALVRIENLAQERGTSTAAATMDIRQLRYFLGVLDAKSLTKAADTLHVAQPALGLQIRKLEEELGVQLLIRHSRGVTPTDAGSLLAGHAARLVRDFEHVRQDLLDFAREPRGRVLLGLTTSLSLVLAARLIERCKKKVPGVSLSLTDGMSERLMEWVDADSLDVALTYNLGKQTDLRAEPLAEETLHFITRAEGSDRSKGDITLAEALTHDMIFPTRPHLVRVKVEEQARRHGLTPRIFCEVDSVIAIRELVGRGLGCSILPYGAVDSEVRAGRMRARNIVDPELPRTLYLAYSARRPVTKAIEAVCDEIRDLVETLVASGSLGWRPPSGREDS